MVSVEVDKKNNDSFTEEILKLDFAPVMILNCNKADMKYLLLTCIKHGLCVCAMSCELKSRHNTLLALFLKYENIM